MENGKAYVPPSLSKDRDEYKTALKPGEPWTFIDSETRYYKVDGIVSDWWFTDEPARLFRITAVHSGSIETVYLGFAKFTGSFEVAE